MAGTTDDDRGRSLHTGAAEPSLTGVSTPRLSIIIPAFKVQAYLRECLESVLNQSYSDFELIAVDDCSPDACGEIMDEFAAADPRVVVMHLPENVGLGRARNAGLERVRGEYVLFLDSDDTLVPGALAAIAGRLDETGDPEVLVYDYARTYWYGKAERNSLGELLQQKGPDVFDVTERPELLNLLMVVWNKAYRRDYIERVGLTFPGGYYEDTPWTYPAMLAARTVAVLDRVCVHYRQRRQGGNILRTRSRKHFDIFEQYDRVFSFVDSRPELARWRTLLYERMVEHLVTILNSPDRLPPEARNDFLRRCAEQCRRYRPAGFVPPVGRPGVYFRMVEQGSSHTFSGLRTARTVARRTLKAGRAKGKATKKRLMDRDYQLQRLRPVDPDLAVFSAYWDRGYACNPAAIHRKVQELAPRIRSVWVVRATHQHLVPEGIETVQPGSREYWHAMARAKYFVNNVNFSDGWVKRPEQVHLQTHHGTPLKSMGLDQQEYPASGNGMSFRKLLSRVDRWDLSLSSNRHSTLVWERVYPSSWTGLELGYPRNDVYSTATAEDVVRIRRELGIKEGVRALLYAPTHRDYRRTFEPRIDFERFCSEMGEDTVLLTRAHYFYAAGGAEAMSRLKQEGRLIDVTEHPSVEELALASDALITDYSSLMFDYANLDRPIVVFADDWETYREARGTYFDITEQAPGAVARSEDELIDVLRTGEWRGVQAAERRAAFRERFCPWDDGLAAERVVRRLFLGQEDGLPAPVPVADRTPAPAPDRAYALLKGRVPGSRVSADAATVLQP
ncbi:bifunctional glycosyltransferase family 2 protein/CDP-glycerol:glycerophosphate glycerophosphotransferase [Streptacidiphilus sp. ASG 303]|uniref:bifunctional glycosyltransferase/CDP-glycerol:glycerophosphate glycerophosphotransferase n=1 Tax=Streptacidiphilus sp. ASG 303 TaxID=2896847 RepID=UPI001E355D82|nr:bifunctional glycosyltransferase family 2 protein/CDP-glycerol:glycerophosphate glycerophosphotransferase [Streptacidiphilus sp. ASG 303]MCD0482073.1 bifunctional glycosyltransferase family 2 protein/CDP-glycerol:glycerophosphate glycerophosphotransferase [Streptacidiphilus sp. ASG 303]